MKKCTNNACRRKFSTTSPNYVGHCPYCGREYPRIQYGTDKMGLLLVDYGCEKIKVIKVVRRATGLGLADTKALVETARPGQPCLFTKAMIKQGDLQSLERELINAGAHCRGRW